MRKKQKKRREKSELLFFSFTFLYFSKISIYNFVLSVFTFILLYYHGFYKQSNASLIDVIIIETSLHLFLCITFPFYTTFLHCRVCNSDFYIFRRLHINILLNDEKARSISTKIRNNVRKFLPITPFQYCTGSPS